MRLLCINISGESDIAEVARKTRQVASSMGFSKPNTHSLKILETERQRSEDF